MGIEGIILIILAVFAAISALFCWFYASRLKTVASLRKLTSYSDGFDLYAMDAQYAYDLDRLMAYGACDNQGMAVAVNREALPLMPVRMEMPRYGCSAFCATAPDGSVMMGRNYDFFFDTSAILVHCAPKNGYESVAFSCLDYIRANQMRSVAQRLRALTLPFLCVDGLNEKGVSIAVLMLDSPPTVQDTGKPRIFTTLAVRLVLDRAATTQEAVDLLRNHDMYAACGGDYHFYVTDASGDGRILEYDCHSSTRELIDIPVPQATNFYELYKERVLPGQYNDIYGHGRERYDRMEEILVAHKGRFSKALAWETLRAVQQRPKPESVTSNTQYAVVYDNTRLTADVSVRRHWEDVFAYSLKNCLKNGSSLESVGNQRLSK